MKSKFSVYKIIFLMIAVMFLFCACKNGILEGVENIDIFETSIYVPSPANQFPLDNETYVETNEPTEAHHPYNAAFTLKPDNEIVIGERDYLTKINYIYNHIDLFSKSTIIVEGMYAMYDSWDETFQFPMVYRNGPACHGDDQYGGFFMVNVPENTLEIDDWIKVEGKPFMYDHTDSEGETKKYLFLIVTKIDKLSVKERKAEMVNN